MDAFELERSENSNSSVPRGDSELLPLVTMAHQIDRSNCARGTDESVFSLRSNADAPVAQILPDAIRSQRVTRD